MMIELHSGQLVGTLNLDFLFLFLSNITSIMYGITSPARSIKTLSPSLISFFSNSSKL